MTIDNINHETEDFDVNLKDTDIQGKQIAGLLDMHAKHLSMRTLKQLEDGRMRAVKAHARRQDSAVNINKNGTLSNFFVWAQHHRIASTGLILAAVIAGLVLMQAFSHQEASDAFLLGADLPPEAFVDRGFEPSLNDGKLKL